MSAVEAPGFSPAKKQRKAGAGLAAVIPSKTKGAGWFTVALAFYHHRQFD
jgi:hypothetical protein